MANVTETAVYDAGVYQIETTDPVSGGASGIANKPSINLANRTAYLKSKVDGILDGTETLTGYAKTASPTFTGNPAAPTPALGDDDTSLATTAFVQDTLGGVLSKSVAGGVNVTLTAVEAGNGILVFTGALTANISVIVPATPTRPWIVYNNTSGAFTLTVKTAAGTGQVITQGKVALLFSDGTNVLDGMTDTAAMGLTGAITSILAGNLTASMAMVTDASGKVANHASVTATELGYLDGVTSAIQTQLDGKSASGHTHTGYAPLSSPVFTGNPTGPTPLRFDNDTSLATTEWVKGEGIQAANVTTVSSTPYTITDLQAGHIIYVTTGGSVVTLPDATAWPVGKALIIQSAVPATINRSGTQTIYCNSGGQTSISLRDGDSVTLYAVPGFNGWIAVGNSGQLGASAAFAKSLNYNGYQILPSGLIIQWGQVGSTSPITVTFPISFTNAVFVTQATALLNIGEVPSTICGIEINARSKSNMVLRHSSAGARLCEWIAIGY